MWHDLNSFGDDGFYVQGSVTEGDDWPLLTTATATTSTSTTTNTSSTVAVPLKHFFSGSQCLANGQIKPLFQSVIIYQNKQCLFEILRGLFVCHSKVAFCQNIIMLSAICTTYF